MRDASLDDFLSDSDEEREADDHESEGGADGDEAASECPEATVEEPESDPQTEAETAAEAEPEVDSVRESEDGSETEPDHDAETEGPPPVADVEPARSTFAWSPDGAACADCGEQVEERWESEVGLVCVECKAW